MERADAPAGLISETEKPIGRYLGAPGKTAIFLSNQALYVVGTAIERVAFDDIESVDAPLKKTAGPLVARLRGGKQIEIPASGQSGRTVDSLVWLRFFNRVLEDRKG